MADRVEDRFPLLATPSAFRGRIRKSLLRHRDEPPIPLPFKLSITHLLDAEACSLLTEDLETGCSSWEYACATPELGTCLPKCGGLYMFVWHPELFLTTEVNVEKKHGQRHVLYVGKASGGPNATIRYRYENEYKQYLCQDPEQLWEKFATRNRHTLLKTYLCLWPLQFWYKEVRMQSRIKNLEGRLIRMLSPPLNTQLKPKFALGQRRSVLGKER